MRIGYEYNPILGFKPLTILSLKEVARSNNPLFTSDVKIHVSSVTSGTSDCTQKVHLSGSKPSARKSQAAWNVFSERFSASGRVVKA